jgi:hypothetical protein
MTTPFSLLVLTPLSGRHAPTLPPFSSRDVTQTLDFITSTGGGGDAMGSWIREDIDGELMDLTSPQFRKFQSVITCTEQDAPSMDGDAWLGTVCLVECIHELRFLTGVGSQVRMEVSGSVRVEGSYTYYRPQLEMMITGFSSGNKERLTEYNWRLSLREVRVP